ncbi:hypothetical protein HOP50_01g00780 [Chloropicon primus]|uniref:Peptidase A1 domain-containing protein n=1 Tax=Chloropicon primus TaxID=1764295 RepID=A0A5B8MBH8_9CHLO|nr:hypothetical protein A3770_01p00870 [Chloropicon primus]UPQ96787.1 hypothetical protein HOP50_01g00780 [Chloropicon primus]|eukprot:QDZ17569.1 hypothetical protein A3770_01p00870 [Chloropicon primus]
MSELLGRRGFIQGVATTSMAPSMLEEEVDSDSDESTSSSSVAVLTMPMRFDRRGGSYVVDWELNDIRFSGVLDTASPFMTVSGSCGEIDETWGCLDTTFDSLERRERRMFSPTYEVYGLQEDGLTDWLRGDVVLRGEEGELRMEDVTFGASEGFGERVGSAPGNFAPMFGLVRDVSKGIRPSLLSQTPFTSFTVDFLSSKFTLGRAAWDEQGGGDVGSRIPLVDLRPMGSPAFEYACKVESLVVNGYEVALDRPVFAVIDTGTTGMLVSKRLWDKSLLQLGVAQCAIELQTIDGGNLVVAASTRSCRGDCLLVSTPIDVLWQPPEDEIGDGAAPKFDVIFVGLAFLTSRGHLSVDLDKNVLSLGPYERSA